MAQHVLLSLVVPVKDEADRIVDFITAHDWAAELIVVDNGSRDETAVLAAAAGARVISCADGTIADARNAGADVATYPWILALDADERAEPALAEELAQLLPTPRADAYWIRRRHLYNGREQRHGTLRPDLVLRLYRRSQRFEARKVHETLHASGIIGTLKGTISHDSFRDRAHHLAKLERYAQWGAEDLYARGRRASLFDRFVRPTWRLVRSFVFLGGFRDGAVGWELARLEAFGVRRKYQVLARMKSER